MKKEDFNNVTKPKHYQGKYGMEALDVVKNFIGNLAGEHWYLYHYGIDYAKCDGSHVWRNDMKTLFGGNR